MSIETEVADHIAVRTDTVPAVGIIVVPIALIRLDNLRTGPVRPATPSRHVSATTNAVPVTCVFVKEAGGFPTENFIGGGAFVPDADDPQNWSRLEKPTIDIYTRVAAKDYDLGLTLATAVLAAINRSLPGADYIESRVTVDQPQYIDLNPQDDHVWQFQVELIKQI